MSVRVGRLSESAAARRDRGAAARGADKLLGEGESYTEISVERLASEADLSRSTFYVLLRRQGRPARAPGSRRSGRRSRTRPILVGDGRREHARRPARGAVGDRHRLPPARADDGGDLRRGRHTTASVREQVDEMMAGYVATLRAHIERGPGRRLHRHEPAPRRDRGVARCGWPSAASIRWSAPAPDAELGPIIDSFTDIVWYTLYAPDPTVAPPNPRRRPRPYTMSEHAIRNPQVAGQQGRTPRAARGGPPRRAREAADRGRELHRDQRRAPRRRSERARARRSTSTSRTRETCSRR